jgi:hypothetical protein
MAAWNSSEASRSGIMPSRFALVMIAVAIGPVISTQSPDMVISCGVDTARRFVFAITIQDFLYTNSGRPKGVTLITMVITPWLLERPLLFVFYAPLG